VLPLFVKAGSIVPMGLDDASAQKTQKIVAVKVYPGADGRFALYQDDGTSYGYERGKYSITTLTWDEAAHRFGHDGGKAWSGKDAPAVSVIGDRVSRPEPSMGKGLP
jgi:alpha-glucosidase/alpha-D-xyloside xylohydrolase